MADLNGNKAYLDLLVDAVKRGNVSALQDLISKGLDVNMADVHGKTALHWAAELGRDAITWVLLAAGAEKEPFCTFSGGDFSHGEAFTPLHLAAREGHAGVVGKLISFGANKDLPSKHGEGVQGDITRHFGTAGLDNKTPLLWAAERGHAGVVKALVDLKCNIHSFSSIYTQDKNALHWAAKNGKTQVVKVLLAAGAEVDAFSKFALGLYPDKSNNVSANDEKTALHWAARGGYFEIVKVLLEAGANVNLYSKFNYYIGDNGDVDFKVAFNDKSALHLAAKEGHAQVVDLLLQSGADIDAFSMMCRGGSEIPDKAALHWAIKEGHDRIVRQLLGAGANTNIRDGNGLSSLDIAIVNNQNEVAKTIRMHLEGGKAEATPLNQTVIQKVSQIKIEQGSQLVAPRPSSLRTQQSTPPTPEPLVTPNVMSMRDMGGNRGVRTEDVGVDTGEDLPAEADSFQGVVRVGLEYREVCKLRVQNNGGSMFRPLSQARGVEPLVECLKEFSQEYSSRPWVQLPGANERMLAEDRDAKATLQLAAEQAQIRALVQVQQEDDSLIGVLKVKRDQLRRAVLLAKEDRLKLCLKAMDGSQKKAECEGEGEVESPEGGRAKEDATGEAAAVQRARERHWDLLHRILPELYKAIDICQKSQVFCEVSKTPLEVIQDASQVTFRAGCREALNKYSTWEAAQLEGCALLLSVDSALQSLSSAFASTSMLQPPSSSDHPAPTTQVLPVPLTDDQFREAEEQMTAALQDAQTKIRKEQAYWDMWNPWTSFPAAALYQYAQQALNILNLEAEHCHAIFTLHETLLELRVVGSESYGDTAVAPALQEFAALNNACLDAQLALETATLHRNQLHRRSNLPPVKLKEASDQINEARADMFSAEERLQDHLLKLAEVECECPEMMRDIWPELPACLLPVWRPSRTLQQYEMKTLSGHAEHSTHLATASALVPQPELSDGTPQPPVPASSASLIREIRLDQPHKMQTCMQQARTLHALYHPYLVALQSLFTGSDPAGNPLLYVQLSIGNSVPLLSWAEGRSAVEVLRVLHCTLQALEHLHSQNLTHGDLTPESILVHPVTGHPHLTGFDLSVRNDDDADTIHLQPMQLLRTGEWKESATRVAPKLTAGKEEDMKAFSAVLLTLLEPLLANQGGGGQDEEQQAGVSSEHLAELTASLIAIKSYTRPTASQAILHSLFDPVREHSKCTALRCSGCNQQVAHSAGLQCTPVWSAPPCPSGILSPPTGPHFHCDACLSVLTVKTVLSVDCPTVRRSMARVYCPCEGCGSCAFPDKALLQHLPQDISAVYIQARTKAMQSKLDEDVGPDSIICTKSQMTSLGATAQYLSEVKESMLSANTLLIKATSCPRCSTVFPPEHYRFSAALQCKSCPCSFCVWCLTDCGVMLDCIPHTRKCEHRAIQDSLPPTLLEVEKARDMKQNQTLREIWEGLEETVKLEMLNLLFAQLSG